MEGELPIMGGSCRWLTVVERMRRWSATWHPERAQPTDETEERGSCESPWVESPCIERLSKPSTVTAPRAGPKWRTTASVEPLLMPT
jgi:hypothetical protein